MVRLAIAVGSERTSLTETVGNWTSADGRSQQRGYERKRKLHCSRVQVLVEGERS